MGDDRTPVGVASSSDDEEGLVVAPPGHISDDSEATIVLGSNDDDNDDEHGGATHTNDSALQRRTVHLRARKPRSGSFGKTAKRLLGLPPSSSQSSSKARPRVSRKKYPSPVDDWNNANFAAYVIMQAGVCARARARMCVYAW